MRPNNLSQSRKLEFGINFNSIFLPYVVTYDEIFSYFFEKNPEFNIS